jgi:NADH-quinone oxidoreductase subunit A
MLNLTEYAGLFIFLTIGIVFAAVTFGLSRALRERSTDPKRSSVYECGMETIGSAWTAPNIRFYVFALLFVIFDVEAVFVLPWAVTFRELGMAGGAGLHGNFPERSFCRPYCRVAKRRTAVGVNA